MTTVSDEKGAEVRGRGFSLTSGIGFAIGLNPFAVSARTITTRAARSSRVVNYWSTGGSGLGFGAGLFNAITAAASASANSAAAGRAASACSPYCGTIVQPHRFARAQYAARATAAGTTDRDQPNFSVFSTVESSGFRL